MINTLRTLPVLALVGLGWGIFLSAPRAEASLLPQIEQALELQDKTEGIFGAITKHYVEIAPGVRQAVRGERERRQVRFFRWVEGLTGDRRTVYYALGYPSHRFRERDGDRVRETWSYESIHLSYVFEGDLLVETHRD